MNTATFGGERLPKILAGLGNVLFRRRNLIFPVAFLGVLLLDRPRYPFGSPRADLFLDALGVLVALAGQVIRIGPSLLVTEEEIAEGLEKLGRACEAADA